jgi:hypothetical protein
VPGDDLPALLGLIHELDRLQRGWRVFTPRVVDLAVPVADLRKGVVSE